MTKRTCICEICGVVCGVGNGTWLRCVELLVFDFFELDHSDGMMSGGYGVEGSGEFVIVRGAKGKKLSSLKLGHGMSAMTRLSV